MSKPEHSAISMTAFQQAELVEIVPDSRPPEAHEVLGQTCVSLISPGTELAVYQGENFPIFPGYAAVFCVDAIGHEVQKCQPGDMVFCMGNHRSFQRLHEDDVVVLPAGLAPEKAVFARMMSVSMSTLTTTGARPPARVVIIGLGLVGYLAAQIFANCGYQIMACDPVPARCESARQAGIASVATTLPIDDPSWAGQTSLVVDCSGHEQAVVDGCKMVKKRGEVVLVGVPWKRKTDLTAHEVLSAIFHRYVVLRSGWEWELPMHATDFRSSSIMENLAAALHWLAEDRIVLDGTYSTLSPADCQQAYKRLLQKPGKELTVLFDWTRLSSLSSE